MIQELADKIWDSIHFRRTAKTIERAWLTNELKLTSSLGIPDVALFLEIGASNQTMVNLISLGLSRAVAIKLNGSRSEFDPELNLEEALEWLKGQSDKLETLGLSELQVSEINEILSNSLPKVRE